MQLAPATHSSGRVGTFPHNMNHSPPEEERKGGQPQHRLGLFPLNAIIFFLLLPFLSVRLDIGHYWVLKTCLLNNKYEALSIKEIRPVMSKTRLNKRKWGQPFFCRRPSTFRVTQGTHILSSGGEENSRRQKPAALEISVSCLQGWSQSQC